MMAESFLNHIFIFADEMEVFERVSDGLYAFGAVGGEGGVLGGHMCVFCVHFIFYYQLR